MEYKYLNKQMTPKEIASLNEGERSSLCEEIRARILEVVSNNGGHLASNLGVVELTVALLSVFDYREDKFIFDVGHQSYAYKLLTGRFDKFDTLRQKDGISGFPRISESPYDSFDTGHSATAVSAAVGYARAAQLNDTNEHVIAIIGDGAMTGGPAYEAINDLGHNKDRVIIILNDNNMSINKNVGGLAKHLGKVRLSGGYLRAKRATERFLTISTPVIGRPVIRAMLSVKDFFRFLLYHKKPTIFEDLGLVYYGPVDGHNTEELIAALESIRSINAPVLLHVCTKKGKGYKHAETHPSDYHGVGAFDLTKGVVPKTDKTVTNFTECFSRDIVSIANKNRNIVAISAAMTNGTGLKTFADRYPTRFFDCGIAEEHCVTMAAGLSLGGKVPIVAIYSSFLQRAYDQILEDVCFMNNHVIFCLDRAGLVGADGHTHNGIYDISYMLSMPNISVFVPSTFRDLTKSLYASVNDITGPCSIRYVKGSEYVDPALENADLDGVRVLADEGDDFAIITCGPVQKESDKAFKFLASKGLKGKNLNICKIKPLDISSIIEAVGSAKIIFTVEEGIVNGGFGSYFINEYVENCKKVVPVHTYGIKDPMVRAGTRSEQLKAARLDGEYLGESFFNKIKE